MNRFYACTGGPGSGKSSLLEALRERGYHCMPEAGRSIIVEQQAIGGRALPWHDRSLFAELMLCWDMRTYRIAETLAGPVFFDRGVADVLGYLELSGLPVPPHMKNAASAFRYNRTVFVAPPWEGIFCQDLERKQDFAEAVRTYDAMVAAYQALGYELTELPRVSIEERVNLVLNKLNENKFDSLY